MQTTTHQPLSLRDFRRKKFTRFGIQTHFTILMATSHRKNIDSAVRGATSSVLKLLPSPLLPSLPTPPLHPPRSNPHNTISSSHSHPSPTSLLPLNPNLSNMSGDMSRANERITITKPDPRLRQKHLRAKKDKCKPERAMPQKGQFAPEELTEEEKKGFKLYLQKARLRLRKRLNKTKQLSSEDKKTIFAFGLARFDKRGKLIKPETLPRRFIKLQGPWKFKPQLNAEFRLADSRKRNHAALVRSCWIIPRIDANIPKDEYQSSSEESGAEEHCSWSCQDNSTDLGPGDCRKHDNSNIDPQHVVRK